MRMLNNGVGLRTWTLMTTSRADDVASEAPAGLAQGGSRLSVAACTCATDAAARQLSSRAAKTASGDAAPSGQRRSSA